MAFKLTDEQRTAVEARGGSLLLSAAAGSGKTAVLTARAAKLMLDEEDGTDADRLLIVTFTRAAAAEMRERIIKKLSEHILLHPDDENAKRQRVLIDRAQIGTIHSVCAELLRQNFHLAGLPASFRIGEETELYSMRQAAVEKILEEEYEKADEEFMSLAELFSTGRSDRRLDSTILSILSFARSHPFYRKWLIEKPKAYRDFKTPSESVWGEILLHSGSKMLEACIDEMRSAFDVIENDETLSGYALAFRSDLVTLCALKSAADMRDWDGCVNILSAYKPERLGRAAKAEPEIREDMKAVRERAKTLLSKELPQKVFCATGEEFESDVRYLLPKTQMLFSLAEKVDDLLQKEKLERAVIDFSDLEQMTCALLRNEDGNRTPLAVSLSQKYAEVMVDEFQDVNEVQNSILTAIARDDNLFCVGDVKQSIYRFRMARPGLFREREKKSFDYDGENFPAILRLNGSFRTAPKVTEIVNGVFSALMSEEAGEIDYDDRHALVPLGKFAEGTEQGVKLLLVEDDDDSKDGFSAEKSRIACEIKRVLTEGTVSDGEEVRRAQPRDIAVLLRSPKSHGEEMQKALSDLGIESSMSLEAGFLTSTEIITMLNALTAISNPLRDLELLGTMTSPLYGFTDDELAAIRANYPDGRLWMGVLAFAEHDEKCRRFSKEIKRLKAMSSYVPPHALIEEVLSSTGYDVLCRAMKNGEGRAANLNLLIQYARDDRSEVPTLDGFLKRMEYMKSHGKDLPPAKTGGGSNAVSIMSIHASKGLEWPIVFIGELSRRHSIFSNDLTEPTILNSDLGFACVGRDTATKRQFVTAPLAALRAEEKRAGLSEELRILYVAMTRAKEQLYLTAEVNDPFKAMREAERTVFNRKTVPPGRVLEGKCYLDWLLPALSVGRSLTDLADVPAGDDGFWVKTSFSDVPDSPDAQEPFKERAECDEELADKLRRRLSWHYKNEKAVALPAKMAVSEISHGSENMYFSSVPSFASDKKLTGAAKGTAVHTFFQYCDYKSARDDPEKEILRLENLGVITAEQAAAISVGQVKTFFESSLSKRIFASKEVLREFRFMAPASCSALSAEYSDGNEAAMLQGVADCIIMEEDGAVLVDYKTDTAVSPQQLCERYRKQLLLYRDMLSKVLPIEVKACIIYSFALGREIPVDFIHETA